MKIRAYLNYGGNCLEAFQFYEKHLGGKIVMAMKFSELPEGVPVPPGAENQILHARLDLADSYIMGSDNPMGNFAPMRSAYLSLSVDSDAEADRIHNLLAEGGEIFMPMQETFYATRFSMLRDRFGTSWMIIHERPMPANA